MSRASSGTGNPTGAVRRLLPLALVGMMLSALGLAASDRAASQRTLPTLDAVTWTPFVEWLLPGDTATGNPFDVEARAVFTHADSGETLVTWLFYDGEGGWRLRFTPTRPGRWRVGIDSDHPDLDGWRGEVSAAPPAENARGFLNAAGGWFARPTAGGDPAPTLWNVYEVPGAVFEHLADLPSDPGERARVVAGFLDEVERNGMDALMVRMYNNWFALGAFSYREHERVDPDPASFALLEEVILAAHARGLGVHIWAWGDEQRRWTPIGLPGGINGESDRRLQRYIAARLAPLPDWTMSYGFDLNEWVTPDEVRAWASYLHERSGWTHLLGAREVDLGDERVFALGAAKLDIYSVDDRPFQLEPESFYALAAGRLAEAGRPVLFERRFYHQRDGAWSADATRRALWQFAIAGGAGGIWGRWEGPPYPNSGQLRTFRTFFARSLTADMTPTGMIAEEGWALADSALERVLVYAEDAGEITLDLSALDGPRRLLAVDARSESYEELDGGVVGPGVHRWAAPAVSDWALILAPP